MKYSARYIEGGIDGFGAVRKDCSHRCYTHGNCTVCDRMLEVAKVLSEKSNSN